MGHIFRLKRAGAVATKTTIVGWSNSTATTYNHGYVDGISDATTTQNEITSIPSPFARIELVKEAFGKIIPGTLNQMSVDDVKSLLSGNTIYHKMVSDTLDVAQIFFSYPTMQDKVAGEVAPMMCICFCPDPLYLRIYIFFIFPKLYGSFPKASCLRNMSNDLPATW
jgi:hypothetical protein